MTDIEFPIEMDGEVRVFRANGDVEVYKSNEIEEEESDEDIKLYMLIKGVQNTFANTSLILRRNWKVGGK